MRQLLCAALLLVATSAALAQDAPWPIPAPIPIPDANTTGISVSLVNSTPYSLGLESNCVEVTLLFGGSPTGHTWIGDLVATLMLTKPGGAVQTSFLFNRIGRTSGSTGFGDSSDALGPYTFTNPKAGTTPPLDIWAAAATAAAAAAVPGGSYRATNSSLVTTSAPPIDLCAPFSKADGSGDGVGTWKLTITDLAGGDTGTLVSASLNLKPEPATMALLGLGALALIRRRRAA